MNASTHVTPDLIVYDRDPATYRHWKLSVDGRVATLAMAVDEEGGLLPGYRLKLNSYDLGVDMELADALQRLRFEYPEVGCVVLTSATSRMFCSGANIYMLGQSSHAWKVNFCKFTNETRNGMEDSSLAGGLKFLAAVNGACAGGGYELALACDEIVLVDDSSSAVSLPEVPLLAVLPGTGGLTRVVDKRKVRRDLADVFCTSQEGVRGRRAQEQGFVDAVVPPRSFDEYVRARALALAEQSVRPVGVDGVKLPPLRRAAGIGGYQYAWVGVDIDRERRFATITVRAPTMPVPVNAEAMREQGADFWPLAMARQLDDAILMLRTNDPEIGLWVLETAGDADLVAAYDRALAENGEDWFITEVVGLLRRTFSRLDVSSRSLYAMVKPGSCFVGLLAELLLAADRGYMLELPGDPDSEPKIGLTGSNFDLYPMANGESRLATRFLGDTDRLEVLRGLVHQSLASADALAQGLVTFAPDDIDWEDEIRLAIDERAALSPDALTGMEASLRFAGRETLWTKVFGRLSAWQNWIFIRPNAVGEGGALKLFGKGAHPQFDWNRV